MITASTSYNEYKKTSKTPLDYKTYKEVIGLYGKFLFNKVLEGHEVTLPARLGTISVIGKEQKPRYNSKGEVEGLAPDWKKTKALWDKNPDAKKRKQLIYHTNEHTAGVRYKLAWSKKRVLLSNKTLYNFRLTKQNKIALNKAIEQGNQYYIKY